MGQLQTPDWGRMREKRGQNISGRQRFALARIIRTPEKDTLAGLSVPDLHRRKLRVPVFRKPQYIYRPLYLAQHRFSQRIAHAAVYDRIGVSVVRQPQYDFQRYKR